MQILKSEAKNQGITLTSGYGPSAAENLASADEAVVKNAIGFYTDILKKLEYLDIHTIGGGIYSYWPVDYSRPVDKAGDWARSVRNVRTVAKIAGECGVDYCLEVLNRFEGYILNTAKEAVQFVTEVDIPAAKVMLDTFHMNIEEDNIAAAIRKAGKRLGHLHLGEQNRMVPGKGSLPWNEIGQALRDIDYKGAAVMEPFVMKGGTIGSEIKVWRDLLDDTSEERLDADAKASLNYVRHVFGI